MLYLEDGALGNDAEEWQDIRVQDVDLRNTYALYMDHQGYFTTKIVNRPEHNSVFEDRKTLDKCMLGIDKNGIMFVDDRGGANNSEFLRDTNRKISMLFESFMMGRL